MANSHDICVVQCSSCNLIIGHTTFQQVRPSEQNTLSIVLEKFDKVDKSGKCFGCSHKIGEVKENGQLYASTKTVTLYSIKASSGQTTGALATKEYVDVAVRNAVNRLVEEEVNRLKYSFLALHGHMQQLAETFLGESSTTTGTKATSSSCAAKGNPEVDESNNGTVAGTKVKKIGSERKRKMAKKEKKSEKENENTILLNVGSTRKRSKARQEQECKLLVDEALNRLSDGKKKRKRKTKKEKNTPEESDEDNDDSDDEHGNRPAPPIMHIPEERSPRSNELLAVAI